MRVLSMTPEQINMLPPAERSTYIQIVSYFEYIIIYASDRPFLVVVVESHSWYSDRMIIIIIILRE